MSRRELWVGPPNSARVKDKIVCGKMCQVAGSLGEALMLARSAVGREDLICITGSFYLIGLAKVRFQPHCVPVAS